MDIVLLKDWQLPKHEKVFTKGSKLMVLNDLGSKLIEEGIAEEYVPTKKTIVDKLFPVKLKDKEEPQEDPKKKATKHGTKS